mgnify:CR=1 FL=1
MSGRIPGFVALFMKVMMMRKKLSNAGSRRLFTATASKTHVKNLRARPARGGNRL